MSAQLRHGRKKCVGILREVKNKWERRTPLIPNDVKKLTDRGIRVLIQPSPRRIFTDEEFANVGAEITDDLRTANCILGVKEFPKESLIPNQSYLIFSHVIKAQDYNMAFLDECFKRNVRLFDYETIRAPKSAGGHRLVAFGEYAGMAGMVDCLRGLGERLLSLGYSTPFMGVASSYMYPDLKTAEAALVRCGEEISRVGLPRAFGPMRFVFTGSGNVSNGARRMFELLPHKWVTVEELAKISPNEEHRCVYGAIVKAEHYAKRKDGGLFDKAHYYANPNEYESVFHKTIAPYTSVLVNGIYWEPRFPRLLTLDHMKILQKQNPANLLTIADVSCDIGGSVECLKKSTKIENPFFMYDAETDSIRDYIEGNGTLMLGVDNLPAEFPREASAHFSSQLLQFVDALSSLDAEKPFLDSYKENFPKEIYNSCIVADGKLTPNFEYIQELRAKNEAAKMASSKTTSNATFSRAASTNVQGVPQKHVLVLGSGYVAAPLVEWIHDRGHKVTVASNQWESVKALADPYINVEPVLLDTANEEAVGKLVQSADVVVSLIPAYMHMSVVKQCLKHKKNMVTASYVSPEMREVNEEFKKNKLILLNEVGLDPGIDHMSALHVMDKVKSNGGSIVGFESWCGGIPAPEAANNPFGYKYSWSPIGMMRAMTNDATYRRDGKLVKVEGRNLMASAAPFKFPLQPAYALEEYANRNSLQYLPIYNLDDATTQTMYRGTLRYAGTCSLLSSLSAVGLTNPAPQSDIPSDWATTLRRVLNCTNGSVESAIRQKLAAQNIASAQVERTIEALHWLGMMNEGTRVNKTVASTSGSPAPSYLDYFCGLLSHRLSYDVHERDLVLMAHKFLVRDADGNMSRISSTLVSYGGEGNIKPREKKLVTGGGSGGLGGFSAMSRTVGLPTAMGVQLILDGAIHEHGVRVPTTPDIYEPILRELENEGIKFVDSVQKIA
jgi:alpha-aminoadipic semialdehyde synthase